MEVIGKMDLEPGEYEFHKEQILHYKDSPYIFGDASIAWMVFQKLKQEYKGASLHHFKKTYYICLEQKARDQLRTMLLDKLDSVCEEIGSIYVTLKSLTREEREDR